MAKFQIILRKLGKPYFAEYISNRDVLIGKYKAEVIEQIDYGPYLEVYGKVNTIDNPIYGKAIKGLLLSIDITYFEEIADKYFFSQTIVWNLIKLDIYAKANWTLPLLMKYKEEVSFPHIMEREEYKSLLLNTKNVLDINKHSIWFHFLQRQELYKVSEILKRKEVLTDYVFSLLTCYGNFELQDLLENIERINNYNFSSNPSVVKHFFYIAENFDFDCKWLSENKGINEQFLLRFYDYYLNDTERFKDFDWEKAINICEFDMSKDFISGFSELLKLYPDLFPAFLKKVHKLEVYKKYFSNLNTSNVYESFSLNFIWDIELFEEMLDLFNPFRHNNYRFLYEVIGEILLSKDIIEQYGKILNGGFTFEKYSRFSLSEGKIYSTIYARFPTIIKEHPKLDRKFIHNILNQYEFVNY